MQHPLAKVVKVNFPCTEVKILEKIDLGYLTENYKVSLDGKVFFLKCYRQENQDQIDEIHRAKHFFADGGIPVILPIKNNVGIPYFSHKNRFFALFPFIQGIIIARDALTDTSIKSLAQMLAKIHLAGENAADGFIQTKMKPWDREKFMTDSLQIIPKIVENLNNRNDFDLEALEIVMFKLLRVLKESKILSDFDLGTYQLIHGDYHEKNVFFDNHHEVTHVFDFEKVVMAPRVTEIIRTIDYVCYRNNNANWDYDLIEVFLYEYNRLFPVSKSKIINAFSAYWIRSFHSLWLEKEHYLLGNHRIDPLYAGYYQRLKSLEHNRNQFLRKIKSFTWLEK